MKLALITSPLALEDEIKMLREMLDLGSFWLHIRKPAWDKARVGQLVLALDSPTRLCLHGPINWALEWGLGGVHYGERLLAEAPAPTKGINRSRAVHQAKDLGGDWERALISPLFDSISKPGYKAQGDLLALGKVKTPIETYALGGVSLARLETVESLGFKGAAVLGAVWQAPKPIQVWHQFLSEVS